MEGEAQKVVAGEDNEELVKSPSKRRRVDAEGKFVPSGEQDITPGRRRPVRTRLPVASQSSGPAPKVVPAKRSANAVKPASALPRPRPATASRPNARPSTLRPAQTKPPTRSTLKHAPFKPPIGNSRNDIND
ncbi:hypothetical protein FRC12_021184 [Ceratobasidium sp. 428]|nr:hypothetical protein FRC12_021184 [Ceratobasidium sp. 428]